LIAVSVVPTAAVVGQSANSRSQLVRRDKSVGRAAQGTWREDPAADADGDPPADAATDDDDDAATDVAVVGKSALEKCAAPEGIPHVANTSACEEGDTINGSSWCTPQCQAGYDVFLDIAGIPPNWACYHGGHSGPTWGAALCCNNGVLVPPAFQCVKDLFTRMDQDDSGALSRDEFNYYPDPIDEATAAQHALVHNATNVIRFFTKASEKGSLRLSEPANPVVFWFVALSSAVLAIFAIYSLYAVYVAAVLSKATAAPQAQPTEQVPVPTK